jgi:hypothetical protein
MFPGLVAQLNKRLQSHLRIAQIRYQTSDIAYATILFRMAIFAHRTNREPHCSP